MAQECEGAYSFIPPKSHHFLPRPLMKSSCLKNQQSYSSAGAEAHLEEEDAEVVQMHQDADGIKPSEMFIYLCSECHITYREKSRVYS